MYRRLIIFGLAVCASALIALLVPLALAARDIVQADQLSRPPRKPARWPTSGNNRPATARTADHRVRDEPTSAGEVTLFYPDGEVRGPNPAAGATRRRSGPAGWHRLGRRGRLGVRDRPGLFRRGVRRRCW